MFSKYYSKAKLEPPDDLPEREVALQTFSGVMIRHLAVRSVEELRKIVIEKKGAHLFVSTASYEDPGAPSMDEKGWKRADLQFDIDVDHFEGCKGDYKICKDEVVPVNEDCEGKVIGIVPERCIERGFEEVKKLEKVLKKYLSIENFEIHFSGNRGFHLIARGTPYDFEGSDLRREIVDFVTGNLFDLGKICIKSNCVIPKSWEPGWRGRLGEALELMLPSGLKTWSEVDDPKGVLERAFELAKVDVDEQVTVDTSRLLRVPGSLHGKSGLRVVKVYSNFSYGPHLSPFHGLETYVQAKYSIDMKVFGERIVLSKGEKASFDGAIGVMLALRGLVELIDYRAPT
ncbi:hypothetical protein EYM_06490 [Ignicoccus islandicus DSM 13165]|uniref:DNA primase small subunit PriS n=1 Tax=Ignicoccus islandicus DSM 13165 TaxID=940295 RepID=A0A0U3EE21_9CREN|nr:hypothetical protein EYM_06490 [Ignicoccus islandicus DSM 13165]